MPWIETKRDAALHWYLGKLDQPYVWSGNEVADGGMDCSGLANGGLRKFEITDRDLRARDLARIFPEVQFHDLRPGDFLFWPSRDGSYIAHVEIVYAKFDDLIWTIGASGGGPDVTTPEEARRRDARVKIRRAPDGWVKAVNPFASEENA